MERRKSSDECKRGATAEIARSNPIERKGLEAFA
jgi:hypothetical protein